MTTHHCLQKTGWAFADEGATGIGGALSNFLSSLGAKPRLLGLGEPTHGEEAFPRLRNHAFQHLVEREGYRSIAIESDCLAALTVDAFVADGTGQLDEAMRLGFSHGFGDSQANRELVDWMRQYNHNRDPGDRLRFYGFDAPTEMTHAESPRAALTALHAYLATNLDATALPCTANTIDHLLGDDERWTNPAAALDAVHSVGAGDEANKLRLVADDLVAVLISESPRLIAATSRDQWWLARLYARTAAGLLRYHAAMADPSDPRLARCLGLRDAMMADNLKAIIAREARRGPTLVFAHNRHLQKDPSTLQLSDLAPWPGLKLQWWSAGAIIGAQLGDQYAFLATALGAAPHQEINIPGPGTLEGFLSNLPENRYIFNSGSLTTTLSGMAPSLVLRTDTSTNYRYFPLDPEHLDGTDGVIFIKNIPSGSPHTST